ncbi:hypothetical protein RchiOBHm_Chr2g0142751 [Rosa chinensis]|uniref:Uncharacterized protein n=1 Tax=Rosa chinensis TaxID=74649 RepID=A0A2P6RXX2_ROSCH|nr:hypothetical protein RchiOBHm_Chr2g0142751 [Rosa chinensis]
MVSICCALTGTAYFAAGLWDLIAKNEESDHFVLCCLLKGPNGSKFETLFDTSSFFLVSAINIEVLVRTHSIQVLDVLTWTVM